MCCDCKAEDCNQLQFALYSLAVGSLLARGLQISMRCVWKRNGSAFKRLIQQTRNICVGIGSYDIGFKVLIQHKT